MFGRVGWLRGTEEATYRNPNNSRVRLDPGLVPLAQEAQRADGARRDELHRQDGVHLADELVADLDGGLGDRAAKLNKTLSVSTTFHDHPRARGLVLGRR